MISAKEIHEIEKKRKTIKKEIYTKIYEQFCKKIKMSVSLGVKSVYLTVPKFVIGYPIFDQYKASVYLQRQLKNAGFRVKLVSQLDFTVSWYSPSSSKSESSTRPPPEDSSALPSLINLKKLASKHKGA
jgi:hypothetical protein